MGMSYPRSLISWSEVRINRARASANRTALYGVGAPYCSGAEVAGGVVQCHGLADLVRARRGPSYPVAPRDKNIRTSEAAPVKSGDRQPVQQTPIVPQRRCLRLVVDFPLHRVLYLPLEVQRHEQYRITNY
jgi:hypothetical protein